MIKAIIVDDEQHAIDILEHVKPVLIRDHVNKLISERLEFDIA